MVQAGSDCVAKYVTAESGRILCSKSKAQFLHVSMSQHAPSPQILPEPQLCFRRVWDREPSKMTYAMQHFSLLPSFMTTHVYDYTWAGNQFLNIMTNHKRLIFFFVGIVFEKAFTNTVWQCRHWIRECYERFLRQMSISPGYESFRLYMRKNTLRKFWKEDKMMCLGIKCKASLTSV